MGNNCCAGSKAEKTTEVRHLDNNSKWRKMKDSELRQMTNQVSEEGDQTIVDLQAAVRAYLCRKGLDKTVSEMLDFPEAKDTEALATSEAHIEPTTLLTSAAQQTLSRLRPFRYSQRVKGAFHQSPRFLKDGSVYVGEWSLASNGTVMRGKGKRYGADGTYCEGYWCNGLLHYRGVQILPNGDCYDGEFALGQRSGAGICTSFDQENRYEGQWTAGMKSGKGKESSAKGIYEGDFQQDRKMGKGMMKWTDGAEYEGEFKDDQVTGSGAFRWPNGRSYTGTLYNCKMNGTGKFKYPDGSSYEGEYYNDKKSGRGVYRWAGNEYNGEWRDGKMHGIGYLTLAGKPTEMCQFRKGKKVRTLQKEEE